MSIAHCFFVIFERFFRVFPGSLSMLIHPSTLILSLYMIPACGLLQIVKCFGMVCLDSLSYVIHHAAGILRTCISPGSGFLVPVQCSGIVDLCTSALTIHVSAQMLDLRIAFFCHLLQPVQRLLLILFILRLRKHLPALKLCFLVSLTGSLLKPVQRLLFIASIKISFSAKILRRYQYLFLDIPVHQKHLIPVCFHLIVSLFSAMSCQSIDLFH